MRWSTSSIVCANAGEASMRAISRAARRNIGKSGLWGRRAAVIVSRRNGPRQGSADEETAIRARLGDARARQAQRKLLHARFSLFRDRQFLRYPEYPGRSGP